jgi:hypothetical protein
VLRDELLLHLACERRGLAGLIALLRHVEEPRLDGSLAVEIHTAEVSQTWTTFVRNHLAGTLAIDLFTVPTVTFDILYVFVVLSLERRRILHVNVTAHPYAEWAAQQIVEAFGADGKFKSSFVIVTGSSAPPSTGASPTSVCVSSGSRRARLAKWPRGKEKVARAGRGLGHVGSGGCPVLRARIPRSRDGFLTRTDRR